jgi:hypothetical protein
MNHERLIGRVVVAWSKLEGAMEDLIWQLLGLDIEQGRVITSRLDAVAKIRMIRSLGEPALTEPQWLSLSETMARIDILREDRNTILHGTWGRDPAGVPFAISLRFTPLAPDQVVSESFPDRRMREICHNIDASKFRLRRLMIELRSSPNKSDELHPEG